MPICVPDLQENDFENLTLSRQIKLVQSIIDERRGKDFGLLVVAWVGI
ncbi:MAG: hypothetical protein CM1200mP16_03170 [Nitrospina sp.]|nr:MAG: hypothetical protein CM1200mP16_03170 [Nitrospina sp.]